MEATFNTSRNKNRVPLRPQAAACAVARHARRSHTSACRRCDAVAPAYRTYALALAISDRSCRFRQTFGSGCPGDPSRAPARLRAGTLSLRVALLGSRRRGCSGPSGDAAAVTMVFGRQITWVKARARACSGRFDSGVQRLHPGAGSRRLLAGRVVSSAWSEVDLLHLANVYAHRDGDRRDRAHVTCGGSIIHQRRGGPSSVPPRSSIAFLTAASTLLPLFNGPCIAFRVITCFNQNSAIVIPCSTPRRSSAADFRVEGVLLERLVRAGARPPVGKLLDLSFSGAPHDLLPERKALLAHDVLQVLTPQIRMCGEGAVQALAQNT